MLLQLLKVHKFQSRDVSGLKMHLRRLAGFKCLFPPLHAQAPAFAGANTWKSILGNRRAQVIADGSRELEKLGAGFNTDKVQPHIFCSGVAAAIAIKTCKRIERAGLQRSPQDIAC